ncbi:telomeric repeat-binding factor 1 [Amia ocellicauda]|uniref:telomeric repeat-binding factor 1 n=1 Tax=Amia ocellicauda TaxID=2972642 RepID=UPI0034641D70
MESSCNKSVPFPQVEHVAQNWMIDFLFRSLCHYFKHDQYKKFNQTLDVLEAMMEGSCELKQDQKKKIHICFLLSRIVNGKNLDVQYEEDEHVTPLLSALSVWNIIKEEIKDDKEPLYEEIQKLLFVQAIGVCLEKGQHQKASHVLSWLTEKSKIPQNLKMKLSLILNKRETYHQFLLKFSFDCLLEKIKTFLDSFLKDYPSDFLLKSASKVVEVCQENGLEEEKTETPESGTTTEEGAGMKSNDENVLHMSPSTSERMRKLFRPKRKLLTVQNVNHWKPETARKQNVICQREYKLKGRELSFECTAETKAQTPKKPQKRKRWTYEEDMQLKLGVKRFGEGNWSLILRNSKIKDRTGVQLKDRWRILKKEKQT